MRKNTMERLQHSSLTPNAPHSTQPIVQSSPIGLDTSTSGASFRHQSLSSQQSESGFLHPFAGPTHRTNYSPLPLPSTTPKAKRRHRLGKLVRFATAIPQNLFSSLLFQLPRFYFYRVTKVFTDADLCLADIDALSSASENALLDEELLCRHQNQPLNTSTFRLLRFKTSWESFIDSLITEWQVQNIVLVLLLTTVVTLLQVEDFSQDPVSRTSALFTLVLALAGVLLGCLYMASFGTMKKMYKAAFLAEDSRRTKTNIWWNTWVFLAVPSIWLSWSVIAFIITTLSYIWRTGANENYEPLSPANALGIRIGLSTLFALAVVCLVLSLKTFARHGSTHDHRWHQKMGEWGDANAPALPSYSAPTTRSVEHAQDGHHTVGAPQSPSLCVPSVSRKESEKLGHKEQHELYRPPEKSAKDGGGMLESQGVHWIRNQDTASSQLQDITDPEETRSALQMQRGSPKACQRVLEGHPNGTASVSQLSMIFYAPQVTRFQPLLSNLGPALVISCADSASTPSQPFSNDSKPVISSASFACSRPLPLIYSTDSSPGLGDNGSIYLHILTVVARNTDSSQTS